jgi:outer membrane immunogenic protein
MRALRRDFARLIAAAGIGLGATAAVAEGLPKARQAPVERPPIWQGLYGGVHFGHADADTDDGFVGGLQLGYNWQMDRIVYGVEGDLSITASDNIDGLGSVRGRLGYLVLPNLLIYGTAGVGLVSSEDTESGFVYGVGVEGMFTDMMTARLEYLAFDNESANGNGVDVVRAGLNFKLGR